MESRSSVLITAMILHLQLVPGTPVTPGCAGKYSAFWVERSQSAESEARHKGRCLATVTVGFSDAAHLLSGSSFLEPVDLRSRKAQQSSREEASRRHTQPSEALQWLLQGQAVSDALRSPQPLERGFQPLLFNPSLLFSLWRHVHESQFVGAEEQAVMDGRLLVFHCLQCPVCSGLSLRKHHRLPFWARDWQLSS